MCFEGNALKYEYERRNSRHCKYDQYGAYSTLSLAQSACNLDAKCRGVYDELCDDSNEFTLCPITDSIDSSSHGDCVYEKILVSNGEILFDHFISMSQDV